MPEETIQQSPAHEPASINEKGVWWFMLAFILAGIMLLVGVWCCFAIVWGCINKSHTVSQEIQTDVRSPDQPLQPSPDHNTLDWQDTVALKASQNRLLHAYSPIPGDLDHVTIPIDRAMQLLLMNQSRLLAPPTHASTQPYINTTQPAATENRT